MIFAGNFIPRDWIGCYGQLMPISNNGALYSLLSTHYGGNGRTDFGIPDLRGRAPIGMGQGPGMFPIKLGQHIGSQSVNLNVSQLPTHSHSASFQPQLSPGSDLTATATATVNAANGAGSQDDAEGAYWATAQAGNRATSNGYSAKKNTRMAADAVEIEVQLSGQPSGIIGGTVQVSSAGSSTAVPTMSPSLGVQYIMSANGVYPSRS
ncbi:tail fiber protein [uncultured Ferrimonas sp.]|uniref:phage tail protein n=1 Tax=uncultured Ferrimonas sp. TaxID=432640 RepID=UPI00262C75EF|nr:tail fiber protein [uncultured Ferrimonas sp.]